MKVLQCIPSMAGGGAERQLAYLARGLVSAGVETHVAVTQGGENLARLLRSGATLHEISLVHSHSPALPMALHGLIRELQPTVVQTWMTQMDIAGGAAAIWNQTPWVVTERNSAGRYTGGLKDRIRLHLGRRASALVANSATGIRYWEPHLAPSTERHVINNGLPVDEITSCPALSSSELPIRGDEKLILFAGRLHSAKNVNGLVVALRTLRHQAPFKAILCGEGPERRPIADLIRSAGMAEQILLNGYASNLWSWMKRADVFVSVSFSEGQPNTVMEAMAARCPLVVSDIPEHREILDASHARLVDPFDTSRIAEVLAEVLRDDEGSRSRAEAAARRAELWSIESMAERYRVLYEQIGRTAPSPP